MSEIYHYQSIGNEAQARFTDKGSKFLATVIPASSTEAVDTFISTQRAGHPKARHFCLAYRLLQEGRSVEYSTDDGEPRGSAGLPILNALRSRALFNVAAVVVRYFGGTKLGIPGLINAYGRSTEMALDIAGVTEVRRTYAWRLSMPMSLQPHLLEAAKRENIRVTDLQYAQRFSALIEAPMPGHEVLLLRFLQSMAKRDDPDLEGLTRYLKLEILEGYPTEPT